jgi:hypothetical protein
MPFPKNLVAYEMSLERAFRMLLGSQVDSHAMPTHEDIGDAFFKKIDPGEFARQWLAEEKYRFPEPGPDPGDDQSTTQQSTQEEELF